MARHARARIPNDVRVREADYFDGSRAPESQGQKGSELATTENPKGEQTNLITKRACLIAKRACAEPDAHFVEILSQSQGTKAQARQMSTPATSNQMNENPTRHPKTENEKERKRKRERGRRRAGARLAPAIHYTGLLGQPVLHRAPGTPNRKTGRRRPTEEHYLGLFL